MPKFGPASAFANVWSLRDPTSQRYLDGPTAAAPADKKDGHYVLGKHLRRRYNPHTTRVPGAWFPMLGAGAWYEGASK